MCSELQKYDVIKPMTEEEHNILGFIPPHGGYHNLFNYQKAEIIYDGTVHFTNRFFHKNVRTIGQIVQAARSGKQNIAEHPKTQLRNPCKIH